MIDGKGSWLCPLTAAFVSLAPMAVISLILVVVLASPASAASCTANTYSGTLYFSSRNFQAVEGNIGYDGLYVQDDTKDHAIAYLDMEDVNGGGCKPGGPPDCFLQVGYGVGCVEYLNGACIGSDNTSGYPELWEENEDANGYHTFFYSTLTMSTTVTFFSDFMVNFNRGNCPPGGEAYYFAYATYGGHSHPLGTGYFPGCVALDEMSAGAVGEGFNLSGTCPSFPEWQTFGLDSTGGSTINNWMSIGFGYNPNLYDEWTSSYDTPSPAGSYSYPTHLYTFSQKSSWQYQSYEMDGP